MNTVPRCTACHSSHTSRIYSADAFPAILFPIEPEKAHDVSVGPLHIGVCETCQHMFAYAIDEAFNQQLYADYYHLYPFSQLESMNEAYRAPFERAFSYFSPALKGKRLLEIGCSDASQLDGFVDAGFTCTGISPGAKPSTRLTMIDAFYEAHSFEAPFDCIVSRFNLEHIIDADAFLAKIKRDLAPGGIFLVQVPNVEHFLASGLTHVFVHEHTQYFNRLSLQRLLERNGFQCVLTDGEHAPSLVCVARPVAQHDNARDAYTRNASYNHAIRALLASRPHAPVILYGAGLSLTGLLYEGHSDILDTRVHIVDDNTLLHGKCMPQSDIPIEPFSPAMCTEGSIVILMLNAIYHDRVLPKLAGTEADVYTLTASGLTLVPHRAKVAS